jgi:hypothetical protein
MSVSHGIPIFIATKKMFLGYQKRISQTAPERAILNAITTRLQIITQYLKQRI